MGAIFFEDELQEGVKETFNYLIEAGIKIWMITGDKTETALSVSKNSGLVDSQTKILEILPNNA